ncbi:hypothetical protein BKA80DRAFT_26134 [Phyllosticta citrichinensis]
MGINTYFCAKQNKTTRKVNPTTRCARGAAGCGVDVSQPPVIQGCCQPSRLLLAASLKQKVRVTGKCVCCVCCSQRFRRGAGTPERCCSPASQPDDCRACLPNCHVWSPWNLLFSAAALQSVIQSVCVRHTHHFTSGQPQAGKALTGGLGWFVLHLRMLPRHHTTAGGGSRNPGTTAPPMCVPEAAAQSLSRLSNTVSISRRTWNHRLGLPANQTT